MSLPRWDDDMKFELLRLKSELKPENFRVLHTPIGIGAVTKAPAPLHKKMKTAPAFSQEPRKPTRQPLAQKAAPSHERAPSARKPPAARRSSSGFFPSLARLLLAHAFDIAFLILSLGLGLLLATWLVDPKNFPGSPELLKQALPIQKLLKTNAFALAFGLYAFFSVYWLFFKLVSGSTLGESFFGNFRSLQNPRDNAPVKDSADS